MKTKKILSALMLILMALFVMQCEKGGVKPDRADDDSDRPDWAGGNTSENPHIKGNPDSGTTQGGDYGDLYVLRRDGDGVPVMTWIDFDGDEEDDVGEHFVQPIDASGNDIDLDQYGELPEGAPVIEVDFGRLNIVRSPPSVLDQALSEALKVLAAPDAVISLDFCGRLTSTYFDGTETIVKTIDSPRESMAIYRTIMQDINDSRLSFLGSLDPLTIAASCFAAGSDKTGTVDVDEVVYINGFMDCSGNNEILNEWEFDFSNNNKYYYNFSEPVEDGGQFQYNRGDVYANRYLSIITLNSDGTWLPDIVTVEEAMDERNLFNGRWDEMGTLTPVELFAKAVDDAVQVLNFVHGDSNITFLPDYTP